MLQQVHDMNPNQLTELRLLGDDRRIPEMLFRYRARNYPESLNSDEQKTWSEFKHERLQGDICDQLLNFGTFTDRINALKSEHQACKSNLQILSALEDYAQTLEASLNE